MLTRECAVRGPRVLLQLLGCGPFKILDNGANQGWVGEAGSLQRLHFPSLAPGASPAALTLLDCPAEAKPELPIFRAESPALWAEPSKGGVAGSLETDRLAQLFLSLIYGRIARRFQKNQRVDSGKQ